MKKIIGSLLLTVISFVAFSQSSYVVKGKILDEATKQPLAAASVFAENTTLGTASDNDGVFTLYLPNGGYNLVITFTGYQTETRRVTTADATEPIVIEIKKKEKSMDEFVVKSTSEVADGLAKYGRFFMENFIGNTENAKQCTIKNTDALKFFYYRRAKRLKVIAREPLEIVNEALGYTIKYELDSFVHEYNTQVSIYTGYPLFQEMQASSETQQERWNAARKVAYNGSILHFMRSLHQKKLQEQGFEIQFIIKNNNSESAIPVKNVYGGMNYKMYDSSNVVEVLPNQRDVAVIYKNEGSPAAYIDSNASASSKFQLSVVSFLPNEELNIEQNGYYYDQKDITITGYWAWEKLGDMLPYNYMFSPAPVVINAEVVQVTEPVKTTDEPVNATVNSQVSLTGVTWKMDESRVIDGNKMFYYKRGGTENSINFDEDLYKFNTDNTGIYYFNGQEYKFTWKYLDAGQSKMEMIIQYPTPLIVNFENVSVSGSVLKYTRMQKVNGETLVAIETRTVK
jgi:CarboxypepD_reg-like domain